MKKAGGKPELVTEISATVQEGDGAAAEVLIRGVLPKTVFAALRIPHRRCLAEAARAYTVAEAARDAGKVSGATDGAGVLSLILGHMDLVSRRE